MLEPDKIELGQFVFYRVDDRFGRTMRRADRGMVISPPWKGYVTVVIESDQLGDNIRVMPLDSLYETEHEMKADARAYLDGVEQQVFDATKVPASMMPEEEEQSVHAMAAIAGQCLDDLLVNGPLVRPLPENVFVCGVCHDSGVRRDGEVCECRPEDQVSIAELERQEAYLRSLTEPPRETKP